MAKPAELSLRIRIARDGQAIVGPGRADLLMHIAATGSIAAGGRQMRMSYKRAWALIEAMNASFPAPLVEAVKGGVGGGGARLTPSGEAVLAAYRELQTAAARAAAAPLAALAAVLTVPPRRKSR